MLLESASGRWLLAPIPKVASTLLKRLAVIADGRQPPERAMFGETRPALAVHHPDQHGLKLIKEPFSTEDESKEYGLRLLVTRHPAERILSFWHDKLYLFEPNYRELNHAIQVEFNRDQKEPCNFHDFLFYLNNNWNVLSLDVHLSPQISVQSVLGLESHHLEREDLVDKLPPLLNPLVSPQVMVCVERELTRYATRFRQDLSRTWRGAYTAEMLAILQSLYKEDLETFSYSLKYQPKLHKRSLGKVDLDALADAVQQVRDRNHQIADLQQQLLEARTELNRPSLPLLKSEQKTWPHHKSCRGWFDEIYDGVAAGKAELVLELLAQYEQAIDNKLVRGECFYLKGLALAMLGDYRESLEAHESALLDGFYTPYVLFNAGNSCRNLNENQLAIEFFEKALSLFPDFSECRHNCALAFRDQGHKEQAERMLRLLLRDHPEYLQASFSLADLLRDSHRYEEAIEAYHLCLQYAPKYCEAWNNLGLVYGSLNRLDDAISAYLQALSIDSRYKQSRQNLAQAYVRQKCHSDALNQFHIFKKLDLSPYEKVIALQGEITCHMELDQIDEALSIADDSADRRIQLISRLHVLPVLYRNEDQIYIVRSRWTNDLHELYGLLEGLDQADPMWELLYAHVWAISNFYLSYQMGDDRSLQELYAGVLDRILRPKLAEFMQPMKRQSRKASQVIRIGIVSPHLHNHNGSIWALGWLESVANDERFEIYSYNTGETFDSGTQHFADLGVYRQLHLQSEQPEPMLHQILDDHLDVLIFTDVGMHPSSKILSVLQLAPIQIQGWGHPITSGSKTMNYYFSGAGMEPSGNEEHYSEVLYRLPNTGLNYERPIAIHDGSHLYDKFDIPIDRPLLASLQSTFKYVPSNDWIFAEIAVRNPQALILFVGHMGNGSVVNRLIDRLRPHFEERDLDIVNHLRVLPRLVYEDYLGFLSISHHTIDTIDWNGGNSSFQSFSLGSPVVTLPTAFMRGRHTVSMLEVMNIPALIASDRADYVSISTRLLSDASFYEDIRAQIKERAHLLFNDQSVADAIKKGLIELTRSK